MNIVIPLGGFGTRFSNSGYIKPKPLIKVLGKEILFWVIDSLNLDDSDTIYIPYNQNLENYNFEEIVNGIYPNIKCKSIPTTNGAAETLKKCIEIFDISGKIVLLDGDTWYGDDIIKIAKSINGNFLTYFETTNPEPIYSYITLKDQCIVDIQEKVKISNLANSGCYGFESATQALEYINNLDLTKNEVYISDLISSMIDKKIIFKGYKIDTFNVLGTPEQVIEFSKKHHSESKRFVFDLDNTLVTFPTIDGDYTSVKPIPKTINYVRNLKKQGHHIIIYTARKMKTHGSNVGAVIADIGEITMNTLKEFDIPYDELFFGKPYAHFYIDDLMINPKTDLNKELGFYMEDVEPRHFNKLIYDSETVTKLSDDNKLEGESYYYKEIQKYPIRKYFPKLISSERGKIVMEKIDGSNFSTLYINEILTTNHLDKLFDSIFEIHHSLEFTRNEFHKYYDYNEKLINRFNSFDYESIGVSKTELNEILNSVKDINGVYTPIHGDLVFSNIILTNSGQLKFIDVKGVQGNEFSIYGHPLYDFAKIYQSLIGYDEILLDKKITESYKRKMISHFEQKFSIKKSDLVDIKNITKSLLVSLIPLHNEPNKFSKYIELAKK